MIITACSYLHVATSYAWLLLRMPYLLAYGRVAGCCGVLRCGAQGIDVKMITGDHLLIGKETARMLGMGTQVRQWMPGYC